MLGVGAIHIAFAYDDITTVNDNLLPFQYMNELHVYGGSAVPSLLAMNGLYT